MLFSVFYVTVNVHSKDNIVSNCTEERGDCERVLSALLLESTKNTLAFTMEKSFKCGVYYRYR